MRLLRRFAPRNDKMVYRITYNVYRLNTVASRKLFQGISRGTPRPFGTPLSRGEYSPPEYRDFCKILILLKSFS